MSGILCSGNVRIALLNDDGTNKGFLGLKNAIELAINPGAVSSVTRASKMIDDYGQNLDTINIPGGPELSISVDDVDADTVGMAFRGDVAALSLPAIVAQDVTLTVAPGIWFPLALPGYRVAVSAVKSTDATPVTYVAGTDYIIDADAGLIMPLVTGTIMAGEIVATIDAPAVIGQRLTPATRTVVRMGIRGRMKNLATGKYMLVNVSDAAMAPTDPVDFLSGNFGVNKMTGPIRTIVGQPPYTVDYLD